MKTSKKFTDCGQRTPVQIDTWFSVGSSIYNNPPVYEVGVALQRENQDPKRVETHETEKLKIIMSPEEAVRLASALVDSANKLNYYKEHGKWKEES